MAGERQLPGLGLYAYWTAGSNGWNTQHDPDTRTVSALLQGSVKSRVTALPGTPTLGDIYLVPSTDPTNPNKVAIWDGPTGSEAWVYLTPKTGWELYVIDEATYYYYNGTAWAKTSSLVIPAITGKANQYLSVKSDETGIEWVPNAQYSAKVSNYIISDSDLSGNKLVGMNVSVANTVTVPSGLTNISPVTIVQIGAGQTTVVAGAGVTINTAETLKLFKQYASATLIPLSADNYVLVGYLEAAP